MFPIVLTGGLSRAKRPNHLNFKLLEAQAVRQISYGT